MNKQIEKYVERQIHNAKNMFTQPFNREQG